MKLNFHSYLNQFTRIHNTTLNKLLYICAMKKFFLFLLFSIIVSSCATKKQVVYLQDVDDNVLIDINELSRHPVIQTNDIVDIKVGALNPNSVIPFNRTPGQNNNVPQRLELLRLTGYVVDQEGNIDFPQLGLINIGGKSTTEAQELIRQKLAKQVVNPNVKLTIINNKFTVHGEVRNPGTFDFVEENLTLPQALGMAGDLTITGRRDNILLIRHNPYGERIVKRIDLTTSDWMNTDAYFIRQNDWIYVEPNTPKVKSAGFVSNVGTLSTVISIILTTVVLITR